MPIPSSSQSCTSTSKPFSPHFINPHTNTQIPTSQLPLLLQRDLEHRTAWVQVGYAKYSGGVDAGFQLNFEGVLGKRKRKESTPTTTPSISLCPQKMLKRRRISTTPIESWRASLSTTPLPPQTRPIPLPLTTPTPTAQPTTTNTYFPIPPQLIRTRSSSLDIPTPSSLGLTLTTPMTIPRRASEGTLKEMVGEMKEDGPKEVGIPVIGENEDDWWNGYVDFGA